jgi:hypothetical protein
MIVDRVTQHPQLLVKQLNLGVGQFDGLVIGSGNFRRRHLGIHRWFFLWTVALHRAADMPPPMKRGKHFALARSSQMPKADALDATR